MVANFVSVLRIARQNWARLFLAAMLGTLIVVVVASLQMYIVYGSYAAHFYIVPSFVGFTTGFIIGLSTLITRDREGKLKESEVNYARALKAANAGTFGLEIGTDNVHLSNEIYEIFDIQRCVEISLITVLKRIHPDDRENFRQLARGQIKNWRSLPNELRIFDANGSTRHLLIFGEIQFGEDGCPIFFRGLVQDNTDRVFLEEQVRNSHKMEGIGKLTGGVAHDFNNLLAVVLGNLELLEDEVSVPEQRELIKNSINATLHGAELTRNMLSFARRAPLEPTTVDLNQLVLNMKNWIGRTLPATINVETSLLAGLWSTKIDASSAESGLLNLILNAQYAMPQGGNLTIETSNIRIDEDYLVLPGEELAPGRYVLLTVSDTGVGIPPGNLTKIFEPFYTTKPVGEGSGLGLSMLQGFMRQSAGALRVYSEPGVGTTFKLIFPATESVQSHRQAAPKLDFVNNDENSPTILLVEDNIDVLVAVRATLVKFGYRTLDATSGDEALKIFEQRPDIELLLTDIVMPGELQGTTLAKKLRGLRHDLPVVFMSGYASEATVHGNGLRPQDIRLMKPVQRGELLRAVKKALVRRALN